MIKGKLRSLYIPYAEGERIISAQVPRFASPTQQFLDLLYSCPKSWPKEYFKIENQPKEY